MNQKSASYDFKLNHRDKIWDCTRIVYGMEVLKQKVIVKGVDEELNQNKYSDNGQHFPIAGMEEDANQIAREIVNRYLDGYKKI